MYGIGEKELFYIALPLICSIISYIIAHKKGRCAWGWALVSLFIPPLIFIIFLLNPTQKVMEREGKVQCPYCREWIYPDAKLCRFCKKELS